MKFRKNRLFRLVITLVSAVAVVNLSRSVWYLWQRRDVVRSREDQLRQAQAENNRLKNELTQVQSPLFVEKEAREKLGMVKEGESVVILPKTKNSELNDKQETKEGSIRNWKKWWKLFF